jgi:TetR/AcrR family transcriptional repressor of nem operon
MEFSFFEVSVSAFLLDDLLLAEPTLRKYVEEQPSMLTEQMIARFTKDKNAGLLPADFDPQLVVPVIVTYMQGLWRMALVSYDRTCFERQNGLLLTSLGI